MSHNNSIPTSPKFSLSLPIQNESSPKSSPSSPSSLINRRCLSVSGSFAGIAKLDLNELKVSSPSSLRLTSLLDNHEGINESAVVAGNVEKASAPNFSKTLVQDGIEVFLVCEPIALSEEAQIFSTKIRNLILSEKYTLEKIERGGINNSYFLVEEATSEKVAIFKSQVAELEYPRSRIGILQGQLCITEAIVMEIVQNKDKQILLPFPTTVLMSIHGAIPLMKEREPLRFEKSTEYTVGSFQKYVKAPPKDNQPRLDSVPLEQVQRLALFDLLSLNTDRSDDNFLITEDGQLVPIDHGCSFPAGFVDLCYFAWLSHPSINAPFLRQLVDYASALSPVTIIQNLRRYFSQPYLAGLANCQKITHDGDKSPYFIEKRIQSLHFSMRVVQVAIERGMTPKEIGLLFVYQEKYSTRELEEANEILIMIHGPSGKERILTYGRILERNWKKIEQAIEKEEPVAKLIEEEINQFFLRYDQAWKEVVKSPEDLFAIVQDPSYAPKLKDFFNTSHGRMIFALYQQERLFEELQKL